MESISYEDPKYCKAMLNVICPLLVNHVAVLKILKQSQKQKYLQRKPSIQLY